MPMKSIFLLIALIFSISVSAQNADSVFTITENPFKDSTHLILHDLDADTISLKIYDRWGRLIVSFYDSIILSGTITVTFHADSLEDGSYIAAFIKNGTNLSKSLVKDASLGLEENEATFLVYPNPSSEVIKIESTVPINELALYSLDGKIQQVLADISNKQINVSERTKGVYLLKITAENAFHIQKVIIH
jgi:hypothetical protein